jgi:ATPases involved in chromosome partitioning
MKETSMPGSQLGTVVSFYSYKGGVGRTMAVVNVAMALAQNGFRVMVVDLDLLAPGVQQYPPFREAVTSSTSYVPPGERDLGQGGILDLVERQIWSSVPSEKGQSPFRNSYRPSDENKETWQKWKRKVHTHEASGGYIDVLPAGPADHHALGALAQIGWYRFLTDFGGLDFMLSMRDQWWRSDYDFTLVDSRTGLSDYLQLCVGILPEVAVLIAGLNEQNVEGFRAAIDGVEEVLASRESDLFIIPVLSLIPSSDLDNVRDRLQKAEDSLGSERELGKPSPQFLTREPVKLPYVATLAVSERLVVPEDHHAPIFREYVRMAEMLSRHRFAVIDNLLNEAIYEAAAKGLTDLDVGDNVDLAREYSEKENYTYGLIRCESLNARRFAFASTEKADRDKSLDLFKSAVALIRKRRNLAEGQRWSDTVDSAIGHWQIELDTLVFYARVLADSEPEAAVGAFTDALEFITTFEKRNYTDIFSDRDWDRYSQELLFTRAFCHLGHLEAQLEANRHGAVFQKDALEENLRKTQALFDQLMPTRVNPALKRRLDKCANEIERLS